MKLVLCCATACLFVVGLGFVAAVRAGAAEESSGQGLQLIKSDEQGIVLELRTPSYEVEQISIEGTPYHVLSVPGYAYNDQPGHPQLPLQGALLAIPPGAEPQLRILEAEGGFLDGTYDTVPVPRPTVNYDLSSGFAEEQGSEWLKDENIYSADALYPAPLAMVESSGFIRDQRFLSLQMYPFQYNPVTQQLMFYRRLLVEISFSYPEGGLSLLASGEIDGHFEGALRSTILNYDSGRAWRRRSTGVALLQAPGLGSCVQCYKISTEEQGIYQLTYTDLVAAGVPLEEHPPGSIDPRTFHIYNQGEEVTLYVDGEEDGNFDLGDYILFYAEELVTKYTKTNIYWFTWGGSAGKRMPGKSGEGQAETPPWFEASARVEEGHFYYTWLPFDEAEHWYWEYLQSVDQPVTKTYGINLSNLYSGEAYSATLRSKVWGVTANDSVNPDHHILFYVNGYEIEDAESWWDGKTVHLVEADFPSSALVEGANVVTVECPGDTGAGTEVVVTDWFEITYRDSHVAEDDSLAFAQDETGEWAYQISDFSQPSVEVFDVTEPVSVSRIISTTVVPVDSAYILTFTQEIASPARYFALTEPQRDSPTSMTLDIPSNLRDSSNGADYLIITHSDFHANALTLANYRSAQGLSTMVVDVQDIYDEFSHGILDPQAIRDFLAYAYTSWNPRPSYVLLVGDGNYDFKDNMGYGEANYVPPYLACLDPFESGCEIPADNRYACVSGTDNMPDMFIGRLPVKTPDEAGAVIDKILAYEASPWGDWRQQALFVADNPDADNDFRALSDYVADGYLPPPYTAEKVYYGLPPYNYVPTGQKAVSVTNAIASAINEGRLLVNYFGHGSPSWWGAEFFFDQTNWAGPPHSQDLDLLTNNERFPLVVSMSCYVSRFVFPSPPEKDLSCLSESLVRAEGKGAVATWGAVGLGEGPGHKLLDSGFFTAVFTDGVHELGAATAQAAWGMASYQYLVDQYVLFGDPAMRLAVQYDSFLPLAVKQ